METPTPTDGSKRINFEEMSKDELVKKCYHLLTIAQKSKQSKAALLAENEKLKNELPHKVEASATQEIIDRLTEQKLSLVTSIDGLKTENNSLMKKVQSYEEKLYTVDNENSSYQRQIRRLTEENEQLLNDLDVLEKQIEKLNEIGSDQHQKLLELEKASAHENTAELQKMLSVSLEEVKRLKIESNTQISKIKDLQFNLSEKDKNILVISEELTLKSDLVASLTNEIENVKEDNVRLKDKLKLYHSKIVKFATIAKMLREDKNRILEISKFHMEQVEEWKGQLRLAGEKIVKHIETMKEEEERLKTERSQSYEHTIETLRNEKLILESEFGERIKCVKEKSQIKLQELKQEKEDLESNVLNEYKTRIQALEQEHLLKCDALKNLENLASEQEAQLRILKDESAALSSSKEEVLKEVIVLNDEKKNLNNLIKDSNERYKNLVNENEMKIQHCEKIISDLKTEIASSEQLCNRSSEELKKLSEENKILASNNETLEDNLRKLEQRTNVDDSECQTIDLPNDSSEQEQQLQDLKRENAELLSEMNEMNQAIKERGENISKLEAHLEEVLKKLQVYETQANRNIDNVTAKEKIIEELTKKTETLNNEIENLRERLNANLDSSYADNESMSTSTISRTDEINRLKDLEGSWEERYGKLRNLAVKLKGKVRELTNNATLQQSENEELQKKLSNNVRVIRTLQSRSDKLEDDLENSKKECKQYLSRLNGIANDIVRDKQDLVSKDDVIGELKCELESLKNEKQGTENWKKQISAKVQTLRKEVGADAVLKKEFESRIAKLIGDLDVKDQALMAEVESHKQTKNLLDQLNNEVKKNSVLSLEMQDYERISKETCKKLDKQQEEISMLHNQVDSQKNTIEALREQIKLLEERIEDETQRYSLVKSETDSYKLKIVKLDEELQQRDEKMLSLKQCMETSRSETEELSLELSKVIAEHQKTSLFLKGERDHLRSQNLGLQQTLREAQDGLRLKTEELKSVQGEYEGYKIRAQSVLRQNQSRDVGLEEKLSEEITSLATQKSNLTTQLRNNEKRIATLESAVDEVSKEKDSFDKQIKELNEEVVDLKTQYAHLSSYHEKTIVENAETIRSLKVHADTLSQCYRQQLSEQEARHAREIIELKSRLDKVPTPTETVPIPPTMPREEGEGSESVDSSNASTQPVSLERLLGSGSDQNVDVLRKQLAEHESKVTHLTALLSDTEKDLIKHIQMNSLLKEEIRRQQRSVEREKHAENLEYLKNVVFKFVTLNSGDERSRLVPVLNTILKLSPEESRQLNTVARGESALKVWSNYLPTWSSPPSKPQ